MGRYGGGAGEEAPSPALSLPASTSTVPPRLFCSRAICNRTGAATLRLTCVSSCSRAGKPASVAPPIVVAESIELVVVLCDCWPLPALRLLKQLQQLHRFAKHRNKYHNKHGTYGAVHELKVACKPRPQLVSTLSPTTSLTYTVVLTPSSCCPPLELFAEELVASFHTLASCDTRLRSLCDNTLFQSPSPLPCPWILSPSSPHPPSSPSPTSPSSPPPPPPPAWQLARRRRLHAHHADISTTQQRKGIFRVFLLIVMSA